VRGLVLLVASIIGVLTSMTALSQEPPKWEVISPDGSIAVALTTQPDGSLFYRIVRNGEEIIAPSRLRLHLFDDRGGFYGFDAVGSKGRAVDETYPLIATKAATTRDRFNERSVAFVERDEAKRKLEIVVRAYDDGVALRYRIPQQPGFERLVLRSEETQFAFPADYACYGLNIGRVDSSHEGEIDPVRASTIHEHNFYDSPLTCESASGKTAVAIAEADLRGWGGMYLSGLGSGHLGVSTRISKRFDEERVVVRREMTSEGIQSPWRVIMLGDTQGRLIESTLIANLNPPTPIKDTSWIKPGKTAWDWWSGPYLPPPLKGGTDMMTIKRYIDFASASGFPYMLIDEGWCLNSGIGGSAPQNADITRTKPDLNMPELVRYAADRNVGLWLWVQWQLLDRQMEAALDQYQAWGIKGIKVDFMDRNDQEIVDYYHRVMSKAAEHKLMVNMHGAYPPTGLARTYPNYLTQEGVMGAEYNKWSKRVTAAHNVTLPYTRMLLGPMDYTPGGFRNLAPAEFKIVNSPPFVQTTRGQALAMYVVYDSPLQMVSDSPDAYENAQGFEFIKRVPTTWDETRFIAGEIAEYVVLARRKGRDWYIGAMTNEEARSITVPLSFLDKGAFQASIWQDGATPTTLQESERSGLGASDSIELKLAPSGGAAVRLIASDW
jgi:alpha-glucosidase